MESEKKFRAEWQNPYGEFSQVEIYAFTEEDAKKQAMEFYLEEAEKCAKIYIAEMPDS